MARLEWTPALAVGIDLIDDQHKEWIDHLNSLAEAMESGMGDARAVQTLGFLIDYTAFHFAAEEERMTELEYPGLVEHQEKHAALKKTLADLARDFEEEGATHVLAQSVDTLLGNWLVKHIRDVDQQFGAYAKGIENS